MRLNCKAPQLAVPEHLFHYPFGILDPEEGGTFGVGSNGTGAFELVELEVARSKRCCGRARTTGATVPYVDELRFVNLGEDPATALAAVASKQVDGLMNGEPTLLEAFRAAAARRRAYRRHRDRADGARQADGEAVRRRACPSWRCARASIRSRPCRSPIAASGSRESIISSPPSTPNTPPCRNGERDVEGAKALLAEAGYPDGIDLTLDVRSEPRWIVDMAQSFKEQWAEAGIRVDLNVMPVPMYLKVWFTTHFGITNWRHRPLGIMVHGLAFRTGVPWNESGFSNAEFDEVLTKAEMTVDVEERRALMERLEQILQDEGPAVQAFFVGEYTVYDKRVKGFRLHPTLYIFGNELGIEQS